MKNKKQAFTLLETLVAVAVFMTAILGPIALTTYSMRSISYGRNQMIAYYLAEDAIEYIKNKRDSNKLAGQGWVESLLECIYGGSSSKCYVDTINSVNTACDSLSGACDVKMKYDDSAGFYNYSTGSDTIFTRTVDIKEVAVHEAQITVELSWEEKFMTRTLVLEGYMFDY